MTYMNSIADFIVNEGIGLNLLMQTFHPSIPP